MKQRRRTITVNPNLPSWFAQLVYDITRARSVGLSTDSAELRPNYVEMSLDGKAFENGAGGLSVLRNSRPFSLEVQFRSTAPAPGSENRWTAVPTQSPAQEYYNERSVVRQAAFEKARDEATAVLQSAQRCNNSSALRLSTRGGGGVDQLPMYGVARKVCAQIGESLSASGHTTDSGNWQVQAQVPTAVFAHAMRALGDSTNYSTVTDLKPQEFWEMCGADNGRECTRDIARSIAESVCEVPECDVKTRSAASDLFDQSAIGASIFSKWRSDIGHVVQRVLGLDGSAPEVLYRMRSDYGLVALHPQTREPLQMRYTPGSAMILHPAAPSRVLTITSGTPLQSVFDTLHQVDSKIGADLGNVTVNAALIKERHATEARLSQFVKLADVRCITTRAPESSVHIEGQASAKNTAQNTIGKRLDSSVHLEDTQRQIELPNMLGVRMDDDRSTPAPRDSSMPFAELIGAHISKTPDSSMPTAEYAKLGAVQTTLTSAATKLSDVETAPVANAFDDLFTAAADLKVPDESIPNRWDALPSIMYSLNCNDLEKLIISSAAKRKDISAVILPNVANANAIAKAIPASDNALNSLIKHYAVPVEQVDKTVEGLVNGRISGADIISQSGKVWPFANKNDSLVVCVAGKKYPAQAYAVSEYPHLLAIRVPVVHTNL